jgi:hypothetical protein
VTAAGAARRGARLPLSWRTFSQVMVLPKTYAEVAMIVVPASSTESHAVVS